jgi:tetratricopeptide (TPR) repeat protein
MLICFFTSPAKLTRLNRTLMRTHTHFLRAAIILLILLLGPIEVPVRPAAAATNKTQATKSANPTAKSAEEKPAAAFTIELYSTKVRFENDGTGERQLDVQIRIGSDSGAQALHALSFDYDNAHETLALNFLRVTKKDGSVVEAKPDAVQDQPNAIAKNAPAFSNIREARITVPPLAAGDTLNYEVEVKTVKPFAPGEFWFAHNFLTAPRALDEELSIDIPGDRAVQVRSSPQFVPNISSQGGRKIYFWKRTISESASEEAVSSQNSSSENEAGNQTPDVRLTSFTSWQSLGKWLATAAESALAPSAEIKAKSQSLIANAQTDSDKISALYDFVAKQIRLVNVTLKSAEFHPRDAAKVLSDGYGDEFDKCTLLLALLDSIGYNASVAMETSNGHFDEAFPFPEDLKHSIVAVSAGKETYWLDPSTPAAPFRYLTPNLRGKQALVASATIAPHLEETPSDPPFLSTQQVDITGRVSSLGKLTAQIRYTLRGDNEYALRMAFNSTPKDQWKQVAQTMATLDGFRGQVVDVNPSDPTATRDPFVLEFALEDPQFLDWSRSQVALGLPLPTFGLPDAPADSTKPIELGSPLDVITKLTLTLPVTDSAQVPVGAGVSRDYAEYQSHYATNDRVITAQRKLRFTAHEVTAARASDYAAFVRAVQADESQAVSVTNIVPDIPADAPPGEVMEAGVAALKGQNFSNALRLFERVRELNPKQPGLWSDLGVAQLQLGKYEDAATSFQNQLAANPSDESANNFLGVALFDEKKYAEAIDAFQKEIKLKPLDPNAYTYLGTVYIQEKQYQEAAAQLEKAAVLSPDDPMIPLRLGEACLGLGKNDAAMTSFDKATKMSPTPAVENEIAFSLAEHNFALDRAQHYAESALKSTESQLQGLDLQRLTQEQLSEEIFLAPIWDTLGWVYFKQDKLEEAESFIHPAWELDERGDVGDHLAQIYGKRGERTLAIRTDTLALATGSAPAETRARLEKLLGSETGIDARVKNAKTDLLRMHMIPLAKSPGEGKAVFLLVLQEGPAGTTVREVKFLGGNQLLATLDERIKASKFPALFPPQSKARIVLRGVATCSAKSTNCEFVFETSSQLLAQK